MLHAGLVSVTFRNLSPAEVVSLCVDTHLSGIEWGGDVHVPHGNTSVAAEVRRMTEDAGLAVVCYGSYFRAGWDNEANPGKDAVIESALTLGAPLIRIWAGRIASAKCTPDERLLIEKEIAKFAAAAAGHGLNIALEYHSNTLTDTLSSTQQLLRAVDAPNLFSLWQPPLGLSVEDNLAAIDALGGKIANAHAFAWERGPDKTIRLPFHNHETAWQAYLQALSSENRWILLEFVRDNDPQQLKSDAATLLQLIDRMSG